MELMTPPEEIKDNPLYSGPMLTRLVKTLSRDEEKSQRRLMRELRQNMRFELLRLQKNDLSDADQYFKHLLTTTDCPMTIQMLGLVAKTIRQTIIKVHEGINIEFKLMPGLNNQIRYSNHLKTINYGWIVTNMVRDGCVIKHQFL